MIPTRKISETVIEFGEPILQELPENTTKEEFEAAFRIVVTAWNAVVLDGYNKNRKFEKAFLSALRSMPTQFSGIPKRLIKRKKRRYSTDPRSVGKYWVVERDGELVFRAEARLGLKEIDTVGLKQ